MAVNDSLFYGERAAAGSALAKNSAGPSNDVPVRSRQQVGAAGFRSVIQARKSSVVSHYTTENPSR